MLCELPTDDYIGWGFMFFSIIVEIDTKKLKKTLLEYPNELMRRNTKEIQYTVPELFIQIAKNTPPLSLA